MSATHLILPISMNATRTNFWFSWTQKFFEAVGSILSIAKWRSPQVTPEQTDRRRTLEIFREVLCPLLSEAENWCDRVRGPATPIMSRDYSLLDEAALYECRALRTRIRQSVEPLVTPKLGPISRTIIAEFLLWLPWTWFPELSDETLSLLGITPDQASRRLALTQDMPASLKVVQDPRDESERLSKDSFTALSMLSRLYKLYGSSVIQWQEQLHDRPASAEDVEIAAGERGNLHYNTAQWADLLRKRGPIERALVAEFLLELPAVLFPPLDNNLIRQLGISRKDRAIRFKITKERPYTYSDDELLGF
jgi:hypothetical protein